jgi:hypothetical protein
MHDHWYMRVEWRHWSLRRRCAGLQSRKGHALQIGNGADPRNCPIGYLTGKVKGIGA